MRLQAAVVLCGAGLAACQNQAPVPVATEFAAYAAYDDAIPGTFALYLEASELSGRVRMRSNACDPQRFRLDGAASFEQSAVTSLRNLIAEVDLVSAPLRADALAAQGYTGQIIIEVHTAQAEMTAVASFMALDLDADVDITASMDVFGPDGRVLRSSADGHSHVTDSAGLLCSNGAAVIADAASEAYGALLRRLGEELYNSDEVRELAAPGSETADEDAS
ncbi:MAG: hypothetical protein H6843_04360 [Rhodospirillaceae bacterium]|nr:hypothetical protein [Rhodospirillaceae bacterium]